MESEAIAIIAGAVVVFALVSRRLEQSPVTDSMFFVAAGLLLGASGLGLVDADVDEGGVRVLAEATLVLLLYTDAIRIDLRVLWDQILIPARLLGIGLPLTVVAGTVAALLLLDGLGLWAAALLAAILAPTDAALGRAVVEDEEVPIRVRQAINVESGLNDGLVLPIITVLLALAASGMALESPGYWAGFAARKVGFGILVGAVVGFAGGWLLDRFSDRGWVDGALRQIATLGIGVAAFGAAEAAGGNGFVAAFCAGLAFGLAAREHCSDAHDFAQDEGRLLALLTFFFFGAVIAGPALDRLTLRTAVFAVLALTVVRMIPVALSLIGTRIRWQTVLFIGWFGPRGLASILFALFILEEAGLPVADDILLIVTWTVLLSVFAHGMTAAWLSSRYGAWFNRHAAEVEAEAVDVTPMPMR